MGLFGAIGAGQPRIGTRPISGPLCYGFWRSSPGVDGQYGFGVDRFSIVDVSATSLLIRGDRIDYRPLVQSPVPRVVLSNRVFVRPSFGGAPLSSGFSAPQPTATVPNLTGLFFAHLPLMAGLSPAVVTMIRLDGSFSTGTPWGTNGGAIARDAGFGDSMWEWLIAACSTPEGAQLAGIVAPPGVTPDAFHRALVSLQQQGVVNYLPPIENIFWADQAGAISIDLLAKIAASLTAVATVEEPILALIPLTSDSPIDGSAAALAALSVQWPDVRFLGIASNSPMGQNGPAVIDFGVTPVASWSLDPEQLVEQVFPSDPFRLNHESDENRRSTIITAGTAVDPRRYYLYSDGLVAASFLAGFQEQNFRKLAVLLGLIGAQSETGSQGSTRFSWNAMASQIRLFTTVYWGWGANGLPAQTVQTIQAAKERHWDQFQARHPGFNADGYQVPADQVGVILSGHSDYLFELWVTEVNLWRHSQRGMIVRNVAGLNLYSNPAAAWFFCLTGSIPLDRDGKEGAKDLQVAIQQSLAADEKVWCSNVAGRSPDNTLRTDPKIIRMLIGGFPKDRTADEFLAFMRSLSLRFQMVDKEIRQNSDWRLAEIAAQKELLGKAYQKPPGADAAAVKAELLSTAMDRTHYDFAIKARLSPTIEELVLQYRGQDITTIWKECLTAKSGNVVQARKLFAEIIAAVGDAWFDSQRLITPINIAALEIYDPIRFGLLKEKLTTLPDDIQQAYRGLEAGRAALTERLALVNQMTFAAVDDLDEKKRETLEKLAKQHLRLQYANPILGRMRNLGLK